MCVKPFRKLDFEIFYIAQLLLNCPQFGNTYKWSNFVFSSVKNYQHEVKDKLDNHFFSD